MDQPEHVLGWRRQADLLARRQRPLVLGARYRRLLRTDDQGEQRPRAGPELEPPVPLAGHGALRGRAVARHLRCADGDRALGRAGCRPREPFRDRPRISRAAAGRCAPTRCMRTTRDRATPTTRRTSSVAREQADRALDSARTWRSLTYGCRGTARSRTPHEFGVDRFPVSISTAMILMRSKVFSVQRPHGWRCAPARTVEKRSLPRNADDDGGSGVIRTPVNNRVDN